MESEYIESLYIDSDKEILIPSDLYNEIVPHLFIGSSLGFPEAKFDCVISAFDWVLRSREEWLPDRGVPHISVTFQDGRSVPGPKVEFLVDALDFWIQRGSVLVRCQAGINRSALIVARYLIKYKEFRPSEAVKLIREKRSPDCLCNRTFLKYLLYKKDN